MTSSSPLSLFSDRPSMHAATPYGGGAVLLLLVVLLFASLWTLFDLVSVAILVMALGMGAALRVWHDRHPTTAYTRDTQFIREAAEMRIQFRGADGHSRTDLPPGARTRTVLRDLTARLKTWKKAPD